MTETLEQLKARARALRNKPPANKPAFSSDEHSRRGKSEKPRDGVKTTARKPSV